MTGKESKKVIVAENLLLVVISVSIVLVTLEFSIRYKMRAWPFEEETVIPSFLTEKDKNLKWRAPPNMSGRNSLGLKSRELDEKEDRHFRIMVLGDSLIDWGETSTGIMHTRVVEEALNAEFGSSNREIECINAGIAGYTTYQELEFLKVYGLDMKPDLVVLGFVFNDVFYKYLHKPTASGGPILPESFLHQLDTRSFPASLLRKSYVAHWLRRKVGKAVNRINDSDYPFEDRMDFYLAWKEYGWGHTERLLREMRELLQSDGIPLMLVAFPIIYQVDDQFLSRDRDYVLYPQKRIRQISEALNVPFLDLTQALQDGGGTELFIDHVHVGKAGNDIIATEMSKFLRNSEMLKGQLSRAGFRHPAITDPFLDAPPSG